MSDPDDDLRNPRPASPPDPVDGPMRLYDTARASVVPFEPGPVVTMYTCGITPYDATHLGHAATYVTYDVLQRRLRDRGHDTRCVRNITDVDDDLLRKARELGVHYLDLAAAETARFDGDMATLDVIDCWSEPRATSAIADIRGFIGMVLDRGHAYQAGGAVYFDVGSFPGFGEVSHYDREEMLRLAAERGGNPDDPNKRDPLDFVLWQPSAPDEPAWESLWGPGRPGWHIECSALALRELDTTIDLHGGGADLIFPHHECERAQSEAATGQPFVRHWMHQAMVRMDGEKMSKSLGNLVFVSELLKTYDPRAIRHRRPPLPGLVGVGRHRDAHRRGPPRALAGGGWRRRHRRARRSLAAVARPARRRPRHPGAVAVVDAAASLGGGGAGRRPPAGDRGCRPGGARPPPRRGGRLAPPSAAGPGAADWDAGTGVHPADTVTEQRMGEEKREAGQLYTVARAVLSPIFSFCWDIEVQGLEHVPHTGGRSSRAEPRLGARTRSSCPSPRRGASPTSARPSTWTAGRPSTSSRPWG
ncbi:MAG: cysteine--tRNA ligase [Acidimicrobiales bacterium]